MFSKVIPQGHCVIVERFGKPVRVAQSGLRFFMPGLDKIRDVRNVWNDQTNREGIFIELTEQICDTGSRECFTKDNVKLLVDCVYRWRVTDPIKAVYEIDQLHKSLKEAVLGEIRSFIGKNELNTVLASRARISETVVTVVSDTVRRWGVNLTGVEVQELKADDATQVAMLQQLEASRHAEAIKLEAEGKAFAVVQEAEAAKKAAILRAEATSEAIKLVAEGEQAYLAMLKDAVGPDAAAKVLIAQKTLDAYRQATGDPAAKVFLPLSTLPPVLTGEIAK
ncbi:MAG: SPFH/Band 7/PHB domain protein [Kiritimatiellae bacterium]|nr:SPFH/Band 7/PHB domain protein [Kiritimatiellia bacterium]